MNKREQLLRQIQQIEFAALDLNLYLDTHPNCKEAVMDYNKLTFQLEKYKKLYEMHYGPLSNFGNSMVSYPFNWINEPWPWENTKR